MAGKELFTTGVKLVDDILLSILGDDMSSLTPSIRQAFTNISILVSGLCDCSSFYENLYNQTLAKYNQNLSEHQNLQKRFTALEGNLAEKNQKIRELDFRLHKNSSNSSLPPSRDGLTKKTVAEKKQDKITKTSASPDSDEKDGQNKPRTESLREKSGLNPGAQEGHDGHGLELIKTDKVEKIFHYPAPCRVCPHFEECKAEAEINKEKRNVYDIEVSTVCQEHYAVSFRCKCHDQLLQAQFPEGVNSSQQYGPVTKALAVLDYYHGCKSITRATEFLNIITGYSISEGTIYSWIDDFAIHCKDDVKPVILEFLLNCKVNNSDETSARANGELNWIHVVTNLRASFYAAHKGRGLDAMIAIGLLDNYKGILVHDCLGAYWHLRFIRLHAICLQHIQRELRGCAELNPALAEFYLSIEEQLKTMDHEKNELIRAGKTFMEEEHREKLIRELKDLIESALAKLPPVVMTKKRGRPKRGVERCLLERLLQYFDSAVLFLRDFDVPYSNNRAEVALRQNRIRQSVSKCFRTVKGLENYTHALSALETARQNGVHRLKAMTEIMKGNGKTFYEDMLHTAAS